MNTEVETITTNDVRSSEERPRLWGPLLWHGALAAIVAAPLLRGGYLLLLDFALVRRVEIVWQPTHADPGPVNGAPLQVLQWLLMHLGYAAAPLLVFGLFLFMGLAAHRAVVCLVAPERQLAAYFAGTVFAINPFTYDRLMQGHLYLLAAYGTLPLLLAAADRLIKEPRARTALVFAVWITMIAWTSLHVLVMLPVLLVPFFLLKRETYRGIVPRWCAVALIAVVLANAWWIFGLFRVQPGELVSVRDVDAYATRPYSTAVIGNVAGLYGFWRHEFRLPKDGVEYWWFLFLPIAATVAYGGVTSVRDRRLRPLGISMMVVVPAAIVLASGTSFSPTAGMFRWLFANVPAFKLFREPQKWAALLPVTYAILGAIGLNRLLRPVDATRERRLIALAGVAALLIPCVYAWTLLWNWDRLRPVRFPTDWGSAEQIMQRQGGGTVLFLPWHLYMTMSFTGTRVTNPGPHYFSGPVISGDNVELPGIATQSQNPVSKIVEQVLFDPAKHLELERMQSTLCVKWVILAKETDYESYSWLRSANGLDMIRDGSTLTLWRAVRAPSKPCT